jgi:hypothetical protein
MMVEGPIHSRKALPVPQWSCSLSSPSHRHRTNRESAAMRLPSPELGSGRESGSGQLLLVAVHRHLGSVVGRDAGEKQRGRDAVRSSTGREARVMWKNLGFSPLR